MDTIFALASARGKAGVSVVRISGPGARLAASQLCDLPIVSHKAALRELVLDGSPLDQALVMTFDGPGSFTGEDVVELHLHGSVAIVGAVLKALGSIDGLRMAEPGEFTRRALENNRLDLAQVEGLSDLIEAETEAQRRQAMRVFSGELGKKADAWRKALIRAASLIEATIDFADEEVPVDVMPDVKAILAEVSTSLANEASGLSAAERVRDGFEVAIVGPPNVGKSSLLNALAGREAAITSEAAGTTRDVIEVRMDINGLPVTFLDTAGIRDTVDEVEAMGVERARKRAEAADLRIILKGAADDAPILVPEPDDVLRTTKADMCEGADISAKSGIGIQDMVDEVSTVLEAHASGAGLAIRERHRQEMARAFTALGIARDRIEATPELAELVSEDLRAAIRALDALVGRVDVEDLLDEIFASFCIGK